MPTDKKQTAMQSLIEHIKTDVKLRLTSEKAGERFVWYIEKYFLEKEREQILEAFVAGDERGTKEIHFNCEQYYTQTYNPHP